MTTHTFASVDCMQKSNKSNMYVPILGTTWVATSLLATHLIKRNFSTQNTAANATSQELEQDPYQLLSKIRYDGNQL
jgi:hypothetical protein